MKKPRLNLGGQAVMKAYSKVVAVKLGLLSTEHTLVSQISAIRKIINIVALTTSELPRFAEIFLPKNEISTATAIVSKGAVDIHGY